MKHGKYQKKSKRAPLWYYLTLIILIGIFAYSAWYLADYFIGSKQQADAYNDLAALVDADRPAATRPQETAPGSTADADSDADFPLGEILPPAVTEKTHNDDGILLEYAPLYELNPDVAGWIEIDGIEGFRYPVMHTPGRPDHYLKRDFYGKYSSWGCIYAREECDLNAPSDNVTLYGHNMNDGSMFGSLKKYTKRSFWEEHRYIRFDTLKEHHTYEIFAVFTTTASEGQGFAYHNFINAASEEQFDTFVATCLSLSLYGTELVPAYGDKIICLSTCEYSQTNGRLVVAAVRID